MPPRAVVYPAARSTRYQCPRPGGQIGTSFWLRPQAGEEMVGAWQLMDSPGHDAGDHLVYPAGTKPIRSDVIRSLLARFRSLC